MKPKYISEVGDLVINDAHPNKLMLRRNWKYLSKRMLWKLVGMGFVSFLGLLSVLGDIWGGDPIDWSKLSLLLFSLLAVIGPPLYRMLRRDSFMINTITKKVEKNNRKLLTLDEVDHIAIVPLTKAKKRRYNLALSNGQEDKVISDDISLVDAEAIAAKIAKYLDKQVIEKPPEK